VTESLYRHAESIFLIGNIMTNAGRFYPKDPVPGQDERDLVGDGQ